MRVMMRVSMRVRLSVGVMGFGSLVVRNPRGLRRFSVQGSGIGRTGSRIGSGLNQIGLGIGSVRSNQIGSNQIRSTPSNQSIRRFSVQGSRGSMVLGIRRTGSRIGSELNQIGLRIGSVLELNQIRLLSNRVTPSENPSENPEKPRINQLGIQYLSQSIHKKVFPNVPIDDYTKPESPALLEIAKSHLKHHNLLGKATQIHDPINVPGLPPILGNSMDEHFYNLGKISSDVYLQYCNEFFETSLPPRPSKWVFKPGWYRYETNKEPEPVPYPLENKLVFDVEVMYKKSHYSVLATCASPTAWYGWVSPLLTNYAQDENYNDYEHLIPMNTLNEEKLIIGYNVSYDRARILEEYNLKQSKAFYLDGMSLHVAMSGLCGHQRPKWHKHQKNIKTIEDDEHEDDEYLKSDFTNKNELAQDILDDPWLNKGAPNSLANVARFQCNIELNKETRDAFSTLNPQDIIDDFNNLMDYCSDDVIATFEVTKKLFPSFKSKIPHPVSFAALRHLGTLILPTTKKWDTYIEQAEEVYNKNRNQVTAILHDRVNELIGYIDGKGDKPDIENDPWLKQLDWTVKQLRLKKNGEPVANQAFLTGYPQWYRDLFKTSTNVEGEKVREINISVRSRITPLLLRLKWENYSLFWIESQGWCFKVPYSEEIAEELTAKGYTRVVVDEKDLESLGEDLERDLDGFQLFKVPHPDGPSKRCTAIMSKSYSQYFDREVLTSEYSYAQEILDLNSTASYWMGNRGRILDQFVVYNNPEKNQVAQKEAGEAGKASDLAIILPKLVSMGTITRRATENTWLTASNAKKNRIGSELKCLISAPPGYKFVGADVDSEELWIAALIGDSVFKIHGSTALSWMTLEGDKNHKTDLHSKTADILGISRNEAKVFNYGRIYGAGVKFATTLLKQCNTRLSDEEAETMAKKLYTETKGQYGTSKLFKRKMYHGGTESVMFNALESIAHLEDPRTPVLGASITDALTAKNLNKNNYLTSRTNWAIQSSGVDYLHLLIISMEYLIKKFDLDARLMITVHDELRYLVKTEDRFRVALCLQISNLWTRAMFAERLGFKELPQSVAFFSEVDIDDVLRKEVTLDCITPSHHTAIPPAESLDIFELLKKEDLLKDRGFGGDPGSKNDSGSKKSNGSKSGSKNDSKSGPKNGSNGGKTTFQPLPLVIDNLTKNLTRDMKVAKAKLEMSIDKTEWKKNIYEYAKVQRKYEDTPKPQPRPKKKIVEYDIVSEGDEELKLFTKRPFTPLKAVKPMKPDRNPIQNTFKNTTYVRPKIKSPYIPMVKSSNLSNSSRILRPSLNKLKGKVGPEVNSELNPNKTPKSKPLFTNLNLDRRRQPFR